jgi:hypothetical protein
MTAASASLKTPESQTPETPKNEPQAEALSITLPEQENTKGVNAVQKEVIDRAFVDPDSRDRLKTVIATFGTQEVKDYFKSKLDTLSTEPLVAPQPNVNA